MLKVENYTNSLLLSAVGDSLGWPLQFKNKRPLKEVRTFQNWTKEKIGGKYWGCNDIIKEGEYSDDTQLMLSIARSIDYQGKFNPEHFAYLELPLWINYERGGGKATKLAARNLLKLKTHWENNFFKSKDTNYFEAGGNGTLMRNLPISLACGNNIEKLVIESFKNSIITHGHSRAIIGTLTTAFMQSYLLNNIDITFKSFGIALSEVLNTSLEVIKKDSYLLSWLRNQNETFESDYKNTIEEMLDYLRAIPKYVKFDDEEYFRFTKALDREFKGSGTVTIAVAIYLFFKYKNEAEEAIFKAVNMIGSDTDTIANIVGSFVGLYKGDELTNEIKELISKVQDKQYLENVGSNLYFINNKKEEDFNYKIISEKNELNKKDYILKIMAWEMGLHEMFWEALDIGDMLVHPALGKGIILDKREETIFERDDYVTKIIKIKFNIGQTAYFRSRVKTDFTEVSSSLSKDILKDFKDNKQDFINI